MFEIMGYALDILALVVGVMYIINVLAYLFCNVIWKRKCRKEEATRVQHPPLLEEEDIAPMYRFTSIPYVSKEELDK